MLRNEFIAKIEGHGSLKVNWEQEQVKLHVHEGERLFEGILVGRTAEEAHWITPRICGVCPIAHNLVTLAAVENAYGIEINETAKMLRQLMSVGQNVQSHVLHLFFLSLPDYLDIDKGSDLADKNPRMFKRALKLKELGDETAYIIAGRNVHPTRTTTGGFHKIPLKSELLALKERFKDALPDAKWTAETTAKLRFPDIEVTYDLVVNDGHKIYSLYSEPVPVNEYKKNIEEQVRENSTAKFGSFQGREVFVGSLARLRHNEIKTKFTEKIRSSINFHNPYHNNIAQALELYLQIEEGIRLIDQLLEGGMIFETGKTTKNGHVEGIGAVEAPRGCLYNEIHLNENGIITYANIITPTVQNLTSIEKSAGIVLAKTTEKSREEREKLLDMLVRAYDPCLSCSVH